ncbi:MAG TPA: hypothetical protein GX697_01055 [Firmicutes bacterium]|nr:hypothetical protein [Bacillota bacterium]
MSLHYAALPLELIFAAMDKEREGEYIEIQFSDMSLIVQPVSVNRLKIVRVISTNPQVYLNPALAPGNYLHVSYTSEEPAESYFHQ